MFLTSLGIEVIKVKMLARWASAVVTLYARLAPLKAITNVFKPALKSKCFLPCRRPWRPREFARNVGQASMDRRGCWRRRLLTKCRICSRTGRAEQIDELTGFSAKVSARLPI